MIYTIIGIIILILVLILLAILIIPFHISFYLQKREEDVRGKFKISWLRIRLIERKIPSEEEEKEEKKKEKKESKFNLDQFLEVINKFLESLDHLKPIFKAFIKSISIENLSLHLDLGLYSPVSTAMISGYFWSISSILNLIPPVNLSITPDFQKSKLDGSVELNLKIKFFWIVGALIRAFTKRPVRDLFRSVRKLNQ